jgi:hypothetical protein
LSEFQATALEEAKIGPQLRKIQKEKKKKERKKRKKKVQLPRDPFK